MYYWPSVCLLCKNAYWDPLLILKSDYFFDIELYELFIDFGYWPLNMYTICKHSLPFYGLPSNSVVFLCCAENFKFDVIPLFCCCLCFSMVTSPNSHYQNQCQGDYSLYFLLHLLWFQVFKSLTHFELIFVNCVKIVVQFYSSTYGCSVFLLLQLFNIVSNQDVACIQLFPSRLLWIFGSSVVSYIYFRIVLILWKMSLKFWWWLHGIYELFWVVQTF